MPVSIIIPVLNEEDSIADLLQQLQNYRAQGHEVILVDGGSTDKTLFISRALVDIIIEAGKGRALQMNIGATQAKHDILWFLHADTLLPENSITKIEQALCNSDWGRFNVKLSGNTIIFILIATMINVRSCFSGIATGDQAIFVKRKLFDSVGGYSEIPLMEDVALSKKMKAISKPVCLKQQVITSSRRWEKNGILSTVLLMWKLRLLYWLGVSAERLARQYK